MIEKISKTTIIDEAEQRPLLSQGADLLKRAVFLDLEHYIYHKPIAIGIFGACVREGEELVLTQYFLENRQDLKTLVEAARDFLLEQKAQGRDHLVTFAGKNDLMMLHGMFHKFNIPINLHDLFKHVDLQSQFKHKYSVAIGLTRLEGFAGLTREGPGISGSTIAKTFASIMNDPDYIHRMPKEKRQRLLEYNAQDVLNLYRIVAAWGQIDETLVTAYLQEVEEKKQRREETRREIAALAQARLRSEQGENLKN